MVSARPTVLEIQMSLLWYGIKVALSYRANSCSMRNRRFAVIFDKIAVNDTQWKRLTVR